MTGSVEICKTEVGFPPFGNQKGLQRTKGSALSVIVMIAGNL